MRRRNKEIRLLRMLLGVGIAGLIILVKKPPLKDWLIIFLLKGYISSIVDRMLVKQKYIEYPVNLFSKYFDTSVVFDYLLFPIVCVYYNQMTQKSKLPGILGKLMLFSVPMNLLEQWFVRNTKLIRYKNGWSSGKNLLSLCSTFLLVRGFIALVRKRTKKEIGGERP